MPANTIAPSTNAQIEHTTRNMWEKGVKDQVLLKMPLMAKLIDRNRTRAESGEKIRQTVKTSEVDGLFHTYAFGQPMPGGRQANLERFVFSQKNAELPISYDASEELFNSGGPNAPVNLGAQRAKDAFRGAKIGLYKQMYGSGASDTGTDFNSVYQALAHDTASETYGNVTRNYGTSVNDWAQGADLDDFASDSSTQGTARAMSIYLIRRCILKLMENAEEKASLMFVMGPDLYLKLKQEVDASVKYEPGPMALKYGFESFTLDGVEIVNDYFLSAKNLPDETTPNKWVLGFNADDWEFVIQPKRAFYRTVPQWQGGVPNGTDSYLGRVLLTANLCCWRPSGSILLTNVS